jgi:hypothetical protein
MATATIDGILTDSDGTAWINAAWTAVPVSPSSPPVFTDGTPVTAVSGNLDGTGAFSGELPRTDSILPFGTTLRITIFSVTSAPPAIFEQITVTAAAVDLGAELSPNLEAPRIQSAAVVYAYNAGELLNPKHGDGYVNTTSNASFLFVGNAWQAIGAELEGPIEIEGALSATTLSALGTGDIPPASTTIDYLAGSGGRFITESPAGDSEALDAIFISLSGDGSSYNEYLRYRAATNTLLATYGLTTGVVLTNESFVVPALDTPFTVPPTDTQPIGLWLARDQTQGGSAIFVLDANTGTVVITNTIEGLQTPVAGAGPSFSTSLIAGPVPRTITWLYLVY